MTNVRDGSYSATGDRMATCRVPSHGSIPQLVFLHPVPHYPLIFPRPPSMSLSPVQQGLTVATTLSVLLSAGCGDAPEIRQYRVERENKRDITSEALRDQFPPIPFRWDVPESWSIASNDQFSVRAWNAGPPTAAARITIGTFPSRTGIPAQVMRWRRQLGLKSEDVEEAMEGVSALKTQNGAGSYARIEGASESIFAFIIPIENEFWIFRYKSKNATAKEERERFKNFCQSLEYVKPSQPPGRSTRSHQPSLGNPSLPTSSETPPAGSSDASTSSEGSTSSDASASSNVPSGEKASGVDVPVGSGAEPPSASASEEK